MTNQGNDERRNNDESATFAFHQRRARHAGWSRPPACRFRRLAGNPALRTVCKRRATPVHSAGRRMRHASRVLHPQGSRASRTIAFPIWRLGTREKKARSHSKANACSRLHSSFVIPLLLLACSALADPGRIYTPPDPAASGGIEGGAGIELTHALAIDHERLHVYRAELTDAGKSFRFDHLPVGKYDLVLVAKNRVVYEGLALGGEAAKLPAVSSKNLAARIAVADSFFNRHAVHRIGIDAGRALVFVERLRDKLILKQSGEKLDSNLRRLEIIELEQADDDWQMVATRHIYREEEPIEPNPPFLKHFFFSGLGNIRVVDSVKQLGALSLPKD